MSHNPYEDSLEIRVLSATPLELVTLLYNGAVDAVRAARGYLASGNIRARSRAVTKAVQILMELDRALDHNRGGELSTRLAALYNYMRKTLLEANYLQTEAGLITVEKLLVSLGEAWMAIGARPVVEERTAELPTPLAGFPWASGTDSMAQERHWSA